MCECENVRICKCAHEKAPTGSLGSVLLCVLSALVVCLMQPHG